MERRLRTQLAFAQGQTPGTLNEDGIAQAKALGEYLKDEAFDFYYSSDLLRTMKTTQEVTKYHPEKEIIPEPLLRERYLAAWQGQPFPKGWKRSGFAGRSRNLRRFDCPCRSIHPAH